MSFSLSRLRRGRDSGDAAAESEPDDEGRMTLVEHLRELRNRLFAAVVAILVAVVVLNINPIYDTLFNLLREPFETGLANARPDIDAKLVFDDVGGPLMLRLKITLVAGLVISCPFWLYQLWAFVVPGLHRKERKWSMLFVGIAAPLFIGGVLLGYFAMPKGVAVLFDFTPAEVSNYINLATYLGFILRLLLVFGVAFLIPVVVILLNMVGVLSAKRIGKWRSGIVFGIFVFAAVATPSVDPITMLLLAIPMCALFLSSEVVARLLERRKRRNLAAQGIDLDIDELD